MIVLCNALNGMRRSILMNKKSGCSQVLYKKTITSILIIPIKDRYTIDKLEFIFLIMTSNDNVDGCIWLNPIAIPRLIVVLT